MRARAAGEARRTRAIVIYPMNALANSQREEIDKFIKQSGLPDHLRPTLDRYTGQETVVASPLLPAKSHELDTFREPGVNVCNFGRFWSGRRDSNPRPRPWQGGARSDSISDEPAMCVLNARQPKNPFGMGAYECECATVAYYCKINDLLATAPEMW